MPPPGLEPKSDGAVLALDAGETAWRADVVEPLE
jgi:hypothetical protein